MAYVGTVTRSVVGFDVARLRGWSAVRRAVVVVTALVVFSEVFQPRVGALAAIAALYVGLQDRAADPARYVTRVMVLESFLLAAGVLTVGLIGRVWAAWTLLIVAAMLAGLVAQHDKALSRMFADVIAVEAFLGVSVIALNTAKEGAVAILIACLVQAGLTRAASRFSSDLPERRPVAAALHAVALHLQDAQLRSRSGTGEAAEAALAAADEQLNRSDLSHGRRRALRKLLADTDSLRREASSLRARRAFDTEVIDDPLVDDAVAAAEGALRACGKALMNVPTPYVSAVLIERTMADVATYRQQAAALAANPKAPESAVAIARLTIRICERTQNLLTSTDDVRDPSVPTGVRTRLNRDLVSPSRSDLKSAGRLGLAAALSLGVAAALRLPYGGWVAATSVSLLRPDHRALTSDTVSNTVGAGLGAAAVLPLIWLTGGQWWADVLVVGVLAICAFAVTAANEGLYIIAITVINVFTRAVVGEDPMAAAQARFVDVLLGCAVALLLLLVLPLRHGRRLRYELADYAQATSDWLAAITREAMGKKLKGRKKLLRRMRVNRVTVQHGLDVRKVEPLGPGFPPWLAQSIFERIHDCERAAVAAEVSLSHGSPPSGMAAEYARVAARDLEHVSDDLRSPGEQAHVEDPPRTDDLKCDTEVENLLRLAHREAATARDMVEDGMLKR